MGSPTIVDPSAVSGEAITWRDILRWSSIIVPIAVFTFWAGVRLNGIQTAIAQVQSDVNVIKAEVKAHATIPGHPQLERRVWVNEQKLSAKPR